MKWAHGMTRADGHFCSLRGEPGIGRIDRDERVEPWFQACDSVWSTSSRRSTGGRRRAAISVANECTGRKAGEVIVRFPVGEC